MEEDELNNETPQNNIDLTIIQQSIDNIANKTESLQYSVDNIANNIANKTESLQYSVDNIANQTSSLQTALQTSIDNVANQFANFDLSGLQGSLNDMASGSASQQTGLQDSLNKISTQLQKIIEILEGNKKTFIIDAVVKLFTQNILTNGAEVQRAQQTIKQAETLYKVLQSNKYIE